MNCRTFGNFDFQVSALGFGCMRLPIIDGDRTDIDEDLAIRMIRYGIDNGINYVDTAYPYHGGNSERVLGKALKDGYRQKVAVADKMPPWKIERYEDFDRIFEEQLERLQIDCVDFYLLHNLRRTSWPVLRDLGAIEWLEKVRAAGKINYLGFSFHDTFEYFKEIIDHYPGWDFCQVQYNYMCEEMQAGTEGLLYAAERGLGIVIMEPLLGGVLADPPPAIRRIWEEEGLEPVDTALQWLWNKPEVSVVLSGMSTMEQVVENVASADHSGTGNLSEGKLEAVNRIRDEYRSLDVVPCTRCGYCMPCPTGVDIPYNLALYNDTKVFKGNQKDLNRNLYNGLPEEARAGACIACGKCEEECPQGIPVSELMPKVHTLFQ